jgi:hypothetical protein
MSIYNGDTCSTPHGRHATTFSSVDPAVPIAWASVDAFYIPIAPRTPKCFFDLYSSERFFEAIVWGFGKLPLNIIKVL